ncbi:unnamed protein product [Auanema sp. JU1783]|nr:unnamed protein product [Auanema sp. JU1783]
MVNTADETSKTTTEQENLKDASRAQGTGLRSYDSPRRCRSCNRDFTKFDIPSSRELDIHKSDGQGGSSSQETSLALFTYLKPRFTSSNSSISNKFRSCHSDNHDTICQSKVSFKCDEASSFLEFPDSSATTASNPETDDNSSVSAMQPSKIIQKFNLKSSKSRSKTPFCPCFSPNVSSDSSCDSDEEEKETETIVGQASNQLPFVKSKPEVPVHKIVEYSYHLVPDMNKIYASTYYWGVMDRFKAEELLEDKPEGTFLLRDSAQNEFLFSVSFRRFNRTLHARIEQENHRFGFDILDQTIFSSESITTLIENYKDVYRCLFFEPQLTHPLHRSHVFSLQELCRASVASKTNYTRVSELDLPSKLKQYIRQYHYTVSVRTVYNAHD